MWNYQLYDGDRELLQKFGKYAIIGGIIFVIPGTGAEKAAHNENEEQ